ncbi:helix-hairpin-helix domain-containing protein [Marinobacter sp. UBA3607]|jgi:predicted flap endonuclease-1-like 5' DNA nuclease|uniref:helix-hairpin-helix domain-containing protein n=1 Tax=Marinobacter sp. UBA3607 TaxID=1946820 RepID=UPI00257C2750|nr:helix-hairpin-helix domain-containing protein [Marinobacter sp. UBA3607]|tara:strand:+ start:14850 stop:15464 length:615 start_codon:yes stop_codon:yes gene_type:complete
MAKKAKPSVDKIVKKVNKEFEKTSAQIEGLISDALQQFDHLQHQIQDPVRKLLKDMDELRDREMKRFNEEFERRMNEFHELQATLLERVGIASKEARKAADETASKAKSAAKSATGSKPAAKKAPAKKPAARKTATPKAAKPADKSDLTRVKGIGPATAKKMKEAGITSIEQIANPSAEDKQKLEAFKSMKGYSQLTAEAKKLL